MSKENKEKLVEVFAGTLWEAEVVKGLLETNGIACVVLNETIGAVTSPYSPTAGDAIVAVEENKKAKALEILQQL